jgi:hypothetical protein
MVYHLSCRFGKLDLERAPVKVLKEVAAAVFVDPRS